METVNCNLCGSSDYQKIYSQPDPHFFKDEWFDIVECRNCGLGFTNPRPSREEMGKYYPSTFYDYFDEDPEFQARRYQAEAQFVQDARSGHEGRSLLDVGCANGDFPRHMQKLGWDVEGVEISSNSKPITDFTVYPQEFPDIPVKEPRYDVVTAWAVLEHVHDPRAYFHKAAEVLLPQGSFIFLVTNFKSPSSRELYREDPPRHTYYYTDETVSRYLSEAGFELEKADYGNKVYTMRPVNWMRQFLYRTLKGRTLRWEDLPPNRTEFVTEHGLPNNLVSNLKYTSAYPLATVDRLLMPLYEQYQMMTRQYGIVTYVARKR